MLRTLSNAFCVIAIALFLWIMVSWCNVMMHNEPDDLSEPATWNVFRIVTEVGR